MKTVSRLIKFVNSFIFYDQVKNILENISVFDGQAKQN